MEPSDLAALRRKKSQLFGRPKQLDSQDRIPEEEATQKEKGLEICSRSS